MVRALTKGWILSDAGDHWTVKLGVRDVEGHLNTAKRKRATALSGRVLGLLAAVLVVLVFAGKLRFCRLSFFWGLCMELRLPGSLLACCRDLGLPLLLLFGPRKCP